jgi:hypothetical protein
VSTRESVTAGPAARSEGRFGGNFRSWPVLVVALAVGAVIFTNLYDLGADDLRIPLLNANVASSWSHLADAAALLAGAVVALLGARRSSAKRGPWISVAVTLVLFFADEVSSLHSHIDRLTRFGGISYGKLLYVPLLVLLVISVFRLTAGTDQVRLLLVGLMTLVVSYAVHVFVLSLAIGWGYDSWAYQAMVGVKEGTALGGLALLLTALWRLQASLPSPYPEGLKVSPPVRGLT